MDNTSFTPGPWIINHWSPSSSSGITCNEIKDGITYYEADGVNERIYGIRAKIDPMEHNIQGSFEGAHVVDIIDFTSQDGGVESKANAHLIASCPDMLDTLNRLLHIYSPLNESYVAIPKTEIKIIQSVINKALNKKNNEYFSDVL